MRQARRRQQSDVLQRELPGWLNGALILGTFATVLWLEQRRTLRQRTENKVRHDARNLAVAALSALAIRLMERPVTEALTRVVHRKRWGLVKQLTLPAWLEMARTVVLLDYTLYLWHVLTHKVPFLWRFHRVHHAHVNLNASPALRFHLAGSGRSGGWRDGVGAGPSGPFLTRALRSGRRCRRHGITCWHEKRTAVTWHSPYACVSTVGYSC
jgi:hypothetical protein